MIDITPYITNEKNNGRIELNLSPVGYENEYMSVYIGRSEVICTVKDWEQDTNLVEVCAALVEYCEIQKNKTLPSLGRPIPGY